MPKSSTLFYNGGDVVVEEIRIVSQNGNEFDLKGIVGDFSIYEDLYSNYLSGSMVFPDSMNIVKNLPVIGQEKLYITFNTPGVDSTPRKLKFDVYKIATYVRGMSSVTVTVRLEFVSSIANISAQIKLNRVMRNMPFSDMVESIYEQAKIFDSDLPPITTAKTHGQSTVVIPNWSPLYAINWCAHRSSFISDPRKSDYLFYQTLDGFNFVPLSYLKDLQSVGKYTNYPGGFRNKDGERDYRKELYNIKEYVVDSMTDKAKETKLGIYSSHMLVHEMTTKSYYDYSFSYRDSFGDTPHLNQGRMIPYDNALQDRNLSLLKYYDKSFFAFDSVDDSSYIDHALERQSLLNRMNSMKMTIDVCGNTNIRVGNIVEVEFLTNQYSEKTSSDFVDSYLSGKYMVTSILHHVVEGVHSMRMTIAQDSYNEYLPDQKQQGTKISGVGGQGDI